LGLRRLWLHGQLQQGFTSGGIGQPVILRSNNLEPPMSAGSKADIGAFLSDVRFTPESGHRCANASLFQNALPLGHIQCDVRAGSGILPQRERASAVHRHFDLP
jgi:hypothetical protein